MIFEKYTNAWTSVMMERLINRSLEHGVGKSQATDLHACKTNEKNNKINKNPVLKCIQRTFYSMLR